MKVLITDRFLRAIKPAGKRQIIWDTAVPNFCVIVSAAGKIDFAIIRRLPGTRAPLTRRGGQWPIVSLAKGREWAREALGDISHGVDPKERQEAARKDTARQRANSFAAVAEDFIVRHVRKLRSGADVEASIRRELISRWGQKPISEITRRDVIEAIEAIADKRPATARKIFAHASKLFNWAAARSIIESSPCAIVKPSTLIGSPEPRQRVLSDSEIPCLWRATAALVYPSGPFVRLLLLTGQRLREVAEMAWAEIELDKALWTVPADRMKSGAAHEVPLAPITVELLRSLPRWTGPFVFSTTGGERPISGFSKIKSRLDALLGDKVADWRFHDLRRTMRTGLGALPVPNNVAEMCIGHAQPGLHRIYDLHGYREEKRRAFDLWAERLAAIVGM